MPKTAETSPIPIVELREDAVFLGPDGTALTDFGMKLQKLIHYQVSLINIVSGGGNLNPILIGVRDDLSRELGIDAMLVGVVGNQFYQMANGRLKAAMRSYFYPREQDGHSEK